MGNELVAVSISIVKVSTLDKDGDYRFNQLVTVVICTQEDGGMLLWSWW